MGKNNIEEVCNYYYLNMKLFENYKNKHTGLTDGQVLNSLLQNKNTRDLSILQKKLKEIKGDTLIEVLGLDTRTSNALRRAGIDTVEQLMIVPICILENNIRSLGKISTERIREKCSLLGISLREM